MYIAAANKPSLKPTGGTYTPKATVGARPAAPSTTGQGTGYTPRPATGSTTGGYSRPYTPSSGARPAGYTTAGYTPNRQFSPTYRPGGNTGGSYNRDDSRDSRGGRDKGPRRNFMIRVPEVRLIDENNENVGVVTIQDAQNRAKEAGFDLVEVSPHTNPPVCRIMDYAKFLYEQNKKQKDNKKNSKQKEMKEFRFTPVIDVGDISFRVRRGLDFLEKGHNVRITMFRKGRQSKEVADEKMQEILTYFKDYSTIEPGISHEGRRSFITFKADAKAKNKQNSSQETEEDKS